jgi:hypothetical protein
MLSGDSVHPVVEFSFFDLPSPRLTDPRGREAVAELSAFRSMGCVGGSIKFVSIDSYIDRFDRLNIKDRLEADERSRVGRGGRDEYVGHASRQVLLQQLLELGTLSCLTLIPWRPCTPS